MMGFKLNKRTLNSIRTVTGLDSTVIANTDIMKIDKAIESRNKRSLKPALSLGGIQPRGSVYLMFDRLFTSKEIEQGLAEIKS